MSQMDPRGHRRSAESKAVAKPIETEDPLAELPKFKRVKGGATPEQAIPLDNSGPTSHTISYEGGFYSQPKEPPNLYLDAIFTFCKWGQKGCFLMTIAMAWDGK